MNDIEEGESAPQSSRTFEIADCLKRLVQQDGHPAGAIEIEGTDQEIFEASQMIIPAVIQRQHLLGIPDDVVQATLADVARKHEAYGAGHVLSWVIRVLRGDVIQLGRLQVERQPGPLGHALHIPETGPLQPALVDDSLRVIRGYFPGATLCCTSWVLDPSIQLRLGDSNLADFARRFRIEASDDPEEPGRGNDAVAKFVFRQKPDEVISTRSTTPLTSLQSLVRDRLAAGYQWTQPLGVLID